MVCGRSSSSNTKSSLVRLRTISPCLLRTVASTLTTLTLTVTVGGGWLCWLGCWAQLGTDRHADASKRQNLRQTLAPRPVRPPQDSVALLNMYMSFSLTGDDCRLTAQQIATPYVLEGRTAFGPGDERPRPYRTRNPARPRRATLWQISS